MLLCQGLELEGHHRDPVPTHTRPGIVGLKGEWLGRRGVDYLPDRYAKAVAKDRDLIDKADVDEAIRVLYQFGEFSDLWTRALHDGCANGLIERRGQFSAPRRET